jgi:signal transduction histidine kinase/ligand-binding sensor domain-containing protein
MVYRIKDGKASAVSKADGFPSAGGMCALARDSKGRIWFAKNGQIGLFQNERFQTLLRLTASPTRITGARSGGIWICSGFHVLKFEDGRKAQDLGEFNPEFSNSEPSALLEDHDEALWIGTTFSGLYRLGDDGFEKIPTSYPSVACLMEDREGSIWVGTDGGGLNQIRPRAAELETTETGLPFAAVQSITEDTNGVVWVTTRNGALAYRAARGWTTLPETRNWSNDASCVTADAFGDLWVGTRHRGLICRRGGEFLGSREIGKTRGITIHTLLATRSGDIWLGEDSPTAIERLRNGQLQSLEVPVDIRSIRATTEDSSGQVWFGTSKGILLRADGDRLVDETSLLGKTPLSIRCLHPGPDGSLWIGFASFGLGRIKDRQFSLIGTAQGLYDDYISQILADDQGWLWCGSDTGIFKVRQKDLEAVAEGRAKRVQCIRYGQREGLAASLANFGDAPGFLRSKDGRLWFPTRTALAVIDPRKLRHNLEPPPVLLTRVTVADKTVASYGGAMPVERANPPGTVDLRDPQAVLRLPPDHGRIEFEFTGLSFIGSDNIRFRYRLEPVDNNWIESRPRERSAGYSRLASGRYRFHLAASSSEGEWSEKEADLALIVSPFFWQTWTFRFAAFGAFTGLIIGMVRYVSFRRLRTQLRVLEQQSALHQERARIAKDIHDDLGANLTQISLLGELAQQDRGTPEKAGEHIGKISSTARELIKSLDEIVWAVNPGNDTLAHLVDYSGQFALDYLRVAGIRCRLDFPEQTPARELSTDIRHNLFLIVKEALHNIVKHSHATEVWLRVHAMDGQLHIAIEDNGQGFNGAPHHSGADGLRNMRQRATEIGGECKIESRPGAGTKVVVDMPLANQ